MHEYSILFLVDLFMLTLIGEACQKIHIIIVYHVYTQDTYNINMINVQIRYIYL